MKMDTQDYLKKALLDTQERVRDFMNYSEHIEDKKLQQCFKEFARQEGFMAQEIQGFLNKNG
ncbi:MAG TPA: hypothetical protein VN441_11215 [Syntrophomonas sp.]|nr:hypothetical protein [Syntrophomonas sp.]